MQARALENPPAAALFILDGHLELLNPPESEKVLKNLKNFLAQWHSKTFAPKIILDDLELNYDTTEQAIEYILKLNPRPAAEYISDTSQADYFRPDVILSVEKKQGAVSSDDFENGIVSAGNNCDFHFEVNYSNNNIPQIRVSPKFSFDSQAVQKAKELINVLKFRQSSILLQGCSIVKAQKAFFINGPGNLVPLTRRKIAQQLGINESTVSRLTGRKSTRSIQTEWGLFPAGYFFPSGTSDSSEAIKFRIQELVTQARNHGHSISDSKITELLSEQGIKVSRRTVNKYRNQLGIENSYK